MTVLVALEDKGVNINVPMRKLVTSKEIPLDVLRFILNNRGIEVANFYEMLRKKHNQKKSPLYHNIVKDIEDTEEIITTLACLLVQITLYGKKLPSNKEIFQREVRAEEIKQHPELTILAESEKSGVLLVKSNDNRQIFMTGHLEYDPETLGVEYRRDLDQGKKIAMPENYYPDNNPWNKPISTWRSHAHLFYSNWLNYYVYQETPFEFV
jgi:hypothetical protein